jgi:hypothetical protein
MPLCTMSRISRIRSHLFVLLGCLLVCCVAASGASAASSKSPNPLPAPGGGKSPNPKAAPHKHKKAKPPPTDTQTNTQTNTQKAPPSDTVQQNTVATKTTPPATKTTPSTAKTPTTSPGIGPHGAPGAGTEAAEVAPPARAPQPGTPVRGLLLAGSKTVSTTLLAQLVSRNSPPTIGFLRSSGHSGSSRGSSGSWAGWLVGCLLVAALLGWGIGIELRPRRRGHERALA